MSPKRHVTRDGPWPHEMLELKAFVQESVHALDDAALQLLSETLRVDVRGCDDRRDVERVLTGLLCLDKDTALGTFLTWLRTRDMATSHGLAARKGAFANTFVPAISPRRSTGGTDPTRATAEENNVKDHHLDEEIRQRLEELKLLEQDFKDAERQVHSGSPSFERLKAFLIKLTRLRAKEDEVRRFFIKRSQVLGEQHVQMKQETLHTRAQLDFFVEGFTNLRRRHDELLEKATQMKAENETAQETFIAMSANESHFAELLHRTLLHQLKEKQDLIDELNSAKEEMKRLNETQQELKQLVSRLKKERGDARKDANSYKLQLRRAKHKLEQAPVENLDCAFFRQQAIQLRASLTTLVALFRESVARDTKSAKQTLSKEVAKAIRSALTVTPALPGAPSFSAVSKTLRVTGATGVEMQSSELQVAKVIEKKSTVARDVDEVVRGVVLLGGREGEAEICAQRVADKLKYVPVDLRKMLDQMSEAAIAATQQPTAAVSPDGLVTASPATASSSSAPLLATIDNYVGSLRDALTKHQEARGARGVILYNHELTGREASLLVGCGVPIDSVIELKVPPPQPPPASKPVAATTTPASAKTAAASRASASPSRGAAHTTGSSPSRAEAKPTTPSSSPTRQSSRPSAADKKPIATPATPTSASPSWTPAASSPAIKVNRQAAFVSMPHVFSQVEPIAFVEDRVEQVIQQLVRQKKKQEMPFIAWDEATNQVNESLLMYTEDVLSMVWAEQENWMPKKPGEDATKPSGTASSSTSAKSSLSPTRGSSRGTTQATSRATTKASSSSTRPGAKPSASPPKKPATAAAKASSTKRTAGG